MVELRGVLKVVRVALVALCFCYFGIDTLLDQAIAHPGDKASDGCHFCRTNCDFWGVPANQRHCHGGSGTGAGGGPAVPRLPRNPSSTALGDTRSPTGLPETGSPTGRFAFAGTSLVVAGLVLLAAHKRAMTTQRAAPVGSSSRPGEGWDEYSLISW